MNDAKSYKFNLLKAKKCYSRIKYLCKRSFILKRKQFPLKICYAVTIKKQSMMFSHGQLYVALSRVTSLEELKILINNNDKQKQCYTKNIVYKEEFNNLPKVKTTSNIFFSLILLLNKPANFLQNLVLILQIQQKQNSNVKTSIHVTTSLIIAQLVCQKIIFH